ncbi:MAG: SpoIIE family protein phosphatase [Clostridia bacterium]|nr:SpoIIE family protein phosphatase [Clostridia bacterium]
MYWLSIGQATLLCLAFYLQSKLPENNLKKSQLFPLLALSLGLGGFVAFSPFNAYLLPISVSFLSDSLIQKVGIACLIFLLSVAFSVAVKAILRKLLKCRLRNDEILFSLLLCVLVGIGVCRFLSVNAYLGIAFFILLTFSYSTKDAYAVVCAFVLSLAPACVVGYSLVPFFIYGIVLTACVSLGRLVSACAFLAAFFLNGYFDGIFTLPSHYLTAAILAATLPCLLFILLPYSVFKDLENKLIFYREKHLPRIAINRNRMAIGEKLFEISSVFREIEHTFSSLSSNEAEQGAKEYIRGCIMEEVCKRCDQYRDCMKNGVQMELDKLIDVGCMKGKTSLLDLPRNFADVCLHQNEILSATNRQLSDYCKYMTDTENAADGRALLANQAQGISEILKNLALEQSEPLRIYTDKERALHVALLGVGIVCSEVLIYGEEERLSVSLVTFGKADVKKIATVVSHLFETNMMISERIPLSQDKFCCILRKKPFFDAAFGVATTKKKGQTASGDTHSVIKIDERRFMAALSDGMGSGEYAQRISESTITLLESFYRAKMPSELVLAAINKLLTFSKEETFACVDIAVIDLDTGEADIVKIGSPLGFILTGSTVKVLEGGSLPLGILDSLHPDTATYTLTEGDVLLFLSDGITDAFGSTADLFEALKTLPIGNPQCLADTLLQHAINVYGGVAKDDMTVLAVRLFKSMDFNT